MFYSRLIALVIFISVFLTTNAQPFDLSGKWQLSYQMPDGKETLEIQVHQSGDIAQVDSRIGKFEMQIKQVVVSWSYPVNLKKGEELASFKGMIKNDQMMKGVLMLNEGVYAGRAVRWKAERMVKNES